MSRRRKKTSRPEPGAFAYEGLDRVLHEKARLGILTALLSHPDGILFAELKDSCDLTDGNLSRHLKHLQEADLVEIWRGQHEGRRATLVRLGAHGRKAFLAYLDELTRVLDDARAAPSRRPTAPGSDWAPV